MSKFEMLNTAVSRRSVLTGALALGSVAALSGCGGNGDGGSSAAAEITSLEVQFVPTNNDGSLEAKAKPFADYLTEKLGVETNVTLATDYTTIVEAMASGQVQLGIMPPAAYVMARNQGCAEALLTSELGAYDRKTGLPIEGELTGTFKGEILRLCMRYETPVVVGTDAHHTSGVGQFGEALAALEDTGFPEELVANTSLEKYERLLAESRRA